MVLMITPRARLKDPKFKLGEETKYAEFILDILGIVYLVHPCMQSWRLRNLLAWSTAAAASSRSLRRCEQCNEGVLHLRWRWRLHQSGVPMLGAEATSN